MMVLPRSGSGVAKLVAAAVPVALLAGFASASLFGPLPATSNADAEQQTASAALRDPIDTLRILDTYAHWGHYKPPSETPGAPSSTVDTGLPPPSGDALQQSFRLVGVEHQGTQQLALLAPQPGAPIAMTTVLLAPAADGLLRLRVGDALTAGITVSTIGADSVSLAATGGNTTLFLYEQID